MFFLGGLLALTATAAWGQAKNPLVGAWKVMEIANPNSAPLTSPQPGLYLFTEKHYSAVRLNGTKPLPDYKSNDAATEAEKVASFDTLYVNTGSYVLDGDKLTLSPQVAKSAFAMVPGRNISYEFTISGNTLSLVQKPAGPALKFVRVE
jgi:hypothetical protein